jgi:hypothetical protein
LIMPFISPIDSFRQFLPLIRFFFVASFFTPLVSF